MMTNFVLNVCKSEPKFWANIFNTETHVNFYFHFIKAIFCGVVFMLSNSHLTKESCAYIYIYM